MLLQEDTLFDNRYLLKRLLGCGGFSEVWLVEDTKVGNKKMALKVYVPERGLDDNGVQIFSSEFELVFDLNHTNLMRPSHFDVCERSPYLLMPYSEQGSVTRLVGQISEDEAWQLLHDVAAGLDYLHSQQPPIIHQDIKPDNILLDQSGHYLISDFGISTKTRSTLRKSMNVPRSGGTMAYMPPERFGKDNSPIKASDIWAVGATVYELLAGDMPFGEHGGLLQKSGSEIPNIPGKWSKDMVEIVHRCLQQEPWNRPLAHQIVEWTDAHFKGEKIVFSTNKTKNPNRKNKNIFWIIGGGIVFLVAIAAISFIFLLPRILNNKPETVGIAINEASSTDDYVSTPQPSPTGSGAIADSALSTNTDEQLQPQTNTQSQPTSPTPERYNTPAPEPAPAAVQSWITEYDRILTLAQAAFRNKNFEQAKTEYNRALTLANRNGDRTKATFVTGQIDECTKLIEEQRKADEDARQQAIQQRLATYNTFNNQFTLGSNFLIVQAKSNNRWGIINLEGEEKEAFTYSQVSIRLKNNAYALKNEQGWTVFDTSANKVATNLENLNDYR